MIIISDKKTYITWVTPISFPLSHQPACSRNWGICVVFPDPVWPTTTVIGYVSIRYSRLSWCLVMGNSAAGLCKAGMKLEPRSKSAMLAASGFRFYFLEGPKAPLPVLSVFVTSTQAKHHKVTTHTEILVSNPCMYVYVYVYLCRRFLFIATVSFDQEHTICSYYVLLTSSLYVGDDAKEPTLQVVGRYLSTSVHGHTKIVAQFPF